MQLLAGQIVIPRTRTRDDQLNHLRGVAERMREACTRVTPDLIALPELAAQEYGDEAFACLDALDDDLAGPVVTTFAELARELGTTIAFGVARRVDARRHISQVLVGPDGRLAGVYDKLHCAQFGASGEAAHFSPGERLLVTEIAGWRVGVVICYDLRFPELARQLADEGAELILHPVAFTRDFSFASWHAFVTTRAMENQLYWLSLNRAGDDWGHSLFCPPLVDDDHPSLTFDSSEQWRWLTLEKEAVQEARERLPLRRNRRDDLEDLPLWRPD
ncbi:carbon-nitrogen hydrolase family protein [Halomonas daqiaonensis]|uniref:Carbon-nitrogen hydrolase family protein n=1 Tax=Halomonas daqiaonensis TaxID=650850 RepID=A0A1H7LP84_9GAMM|nr:carbon-nitrogen hydrolase family protein [Halomonas daqiaonensis]SEL00659.1 carbon-nitrogen hydrolase family protein [Halomonas daqiaonensis]